MLAGVLYMQFAIAHLCTATTAAPATYEDPATARRGESALRLPGPLGGRPGP